MDAVEKQVDFLWGLYCDTRAIHNLVLGFFQDEKKATTWMKTPNPNLGNRSPMYFISVGRTAKVFKWVQHQLEEQDKKHKEMQEELKNFKL